MNYTVLILGYCKVLSLEKDNATFQSAAGVAPKIIGDS